MEVGNFSPITHTRTDSIRARAFVEFYRKLNYDVVGLGQRELMFGLPEWKMAAAEGMPIVAANIFSDSNYRHPVFDQWMIKNDNGVKLGVIGLVAPESWTHRQDTAQAAYLKSPWEMSKLIRKVARKCDHLTVFGEFRLALAESLAKALPEVDLLISSGIKTGDKPRQIGKTVIVGSPAKGYFGNYIDWNLAAADSLMYKSTQATLDGAMVEDSIAIGILNSMRAQISAPAK